MYRIVKILFEMSHARNASEGEDARVTRRDICVCR